MSGLRRILFVIPWLLAARHARGEEPDPRQLFKDARYDAAAAGFEQRFDRTREAIDGVNAVIAWRAAGRYAHARTLLRRVRPTVSGEAATLVTRVQLLERKMAELTGTIVFAHLLAESTITIDGRPAESEAGEEVVDVGIREIVITHAACEPLRRSVAVLPDQRVTLDAALPCAEQNGNLHVQVAGLGARAYVDGERHEIGAQDLDVPIAPGLHHLVVRRFGVTIEDTWIEVPERGTARHHVSVPYRARAWALTVSGVGGAAASGDGERSLFAGLGFGYVMALGADQRGMAEIQMDAGKSIHHVEGLRGNSSYLAVLGAFRFLGPLWQRRLGHALLTLDVDPVSVRMIAATTGAYLDGDNVFKYYLMFGSITLGADWRGGRLSVVAWPAGIATWGSNSLDAERASYCGSVMLSLNWPLLGI